MNYLEKYVTYELPGKYVTYELLLSIAEFNLMVRSIIVQHSESYTVISERRYFLVMTSLAPVTSQAPCIESLFLVVLLFQIVYSRRRGYALKTDRMKTVRLWSSGGVSGYYEIHSVFTWR